MSHVSTRTAFIIPYLWYEKKILLSVTSPKITIRPATDTVAGRILLRPCRLLVSAVNNRYGNDRHTDKPSRHTAHSTHHNDSTARVHYNMMRCVHKARSIPHSRTPAPKTVFSVVCAPSSMIDLHALSDTFSPSPSHLSLQSMIPSLHMSVPSQKETTHCRLFLLIHIIRSCSARLHSISSRYRLHLRRLFRSRGRDV